MDPHDFISLAIKLSNSQNEAELRSAVSRAYYGAFHLAGQFLEDCGLRWPRKEIYAAEIHGKVRYCLSESANADAVLASDKLWSLRDLRNKADYNLGSKLFTRAGVAPMIRVSQEIAEALQRCRVEPAFSEARGKIAIYARDVLRITVETAEG